jgi:glucosamine--fructose-6-phosphate aminotransferase (isomerizing)
MGRAESEGALGSEGYAMYREIWEGPAAYRETLEGLGSLDDLAGSILKLYRAIIACSCGSSHHAGLALCYAASRLAGLTAYAVQASEYPAYAHHHVGAEHLLVTISQSGETRDTIRAVQMAREKGVGVLAVTGGVGSSLAGLADHVLLLGGGAEKAVPATKSFISQLAACYAFASALSRAAGGQDPGRELQAQPEMLEEALARSESFAREYAESLAAVRSLFILGYGPSFIAALEAALKLKETCGIHAEAYSVWEFRHGPISLLDGERPCVMIVPPRPGDSLEAFEKVAATARGAGARVLLVSHSPLRMDVSESLTIPETRDEFATALEAAPFQLLAYYTALRKGLDPDRPRLLTKVVR